MKFILSFLAGGIFGAAIIWFGFTKNVILVNGSTLVEINRFTGAAKELHYSYEEANRLRREEDARVEKFEAEWAKKQLAAQPAEAESKPVEKEAVGPEITAEELSQVKFVGTLPENSSYLSYRIYNGTKKVITSAEVRIEGVDKASGLPIGRNLSLRFDLPPASDINSTLEVPYGRIGGELSTDVKITLVKIRSAAAETP